MKGLIRKNIILILCFALLVGAFSESASADSSLETSTAGIYEWRQNTPQEGDKEGHVRWADLYGDLVWGSACCVLSVAIQIARTDLVKVDESAEVFDNRVGHMTGFNPASFARAWRESGYLYYDAYIASWQRVSDIVPGFELVTGTVEGFEQTALYRYLFDASNRKTIVRDFTTLLNDGFYPIVQCYGSYGSHYVPVVGVSEDDVIVVDPADGNVKSLFDVRVTRYSRRWFPKAFRDFCSSNFGTEGVGCCLLYTADSSRNREDFTYTLCLDAGFDISLNRSSEIKKYPYSSSKTLYNAEKNDFYTATRLFENDEGEYWYEVMFEDSFAYLPADATNEYMPQGLLDILSPPPAEKNE